MVTKEELIIKYEKALLLQKVMQEAVPLSNAPQHMLLDQNIHIFENVIEDIKNLEVC